MEMNELVQIKRNDVFTDSWIIAENINRQHRAITAIIRRHESDFNDLGSLFTYTASVSKTRGQERIIYSLNEQQAIFLMALMDNSPVVIEFKKALARSFVSMRKLLLEKQTADWQQARLESKHVRLQETDAIRDLVFYAKSQGSEHADMLYMNYSRLIKSLCEYQKRDQADTETLTMIIAFERLLSGIITSEMAANTYYKTIYQKAKAQLLEIKRLWSTPQLTA